MTIELRSALIVILSITLIRLLYLFHSGLELYGDEAQYWFWSTKLDWGYFSKPPMVAWVIALTTILGESDAFVRLGSPLLHLGTSLFIFFISKK